MTKKLKKIATILLAGVLACFSLTACSDEVEVKPDEPMSPSEILNALKNASDYTITLTDGDDYNITVKKDGKLVHEVQTGSASWGSNDLEIYCDYSGSATFTKYVLNNGSWETTEYNVSDLTNAFNTNVKHAIPVDNIDALFNEAYYTSTTPGSYTMTAAGLELIGEDAVTITSSGVIYTIKIDNFWTVTINFTDVILTLPTVA